MCTLCMYVITLIQKLFYQLVAFSLLEGKSLLCFRLSSLRFLCLVLGCEMAAIWRMGLFLPGLMKCSLHTCGGPSFYSSVTVNQCHVNHVTYKSGNQVPWDGSKYFILNESPIYSHNILIVHQMWYLQKGNLPHQVVCVTVPVSSLAGGKGRKGWVSLSSAFPSSA